MKQIRVSSCFNAIIDDEDYERLSKFKWRRLPNGLVMRAERQADKSYKTIYLHREVVGVADSYTAVKHANGDPLDNRKSNLVVGKRSETESEIEKRKHTEFKAKKIQIVQNEDGTFSSFILVGHEKHFVAKCGVEAAARKRAETQISLMGSASPPTRHCYEESDS